MKYTSYMIYTFFVGGFGKEGQVVAIGNFKLDGIKPVGTNVYDRRDRKWKVLAMTEQELFLTTAKKLIYEFAYELVSNFQVRGDMRFLNKEKYIALWIRPIVKRPNLKPIEIFSSTQLYVETLKIYNKLSEKFGLME